MLQRLVFGSFIAVCGCGESSANPASDGSSEGTSTVTTTAATTTTDVDVTGTVDSSSGPTADSTGDTSAEPMWLGLGPYAVGHTSSTLAMIDDRVARVQWWYPAEAAGKPVGLADLEPPGAEHDVLVGLVDAAPEPCTRKVLGSGADVTALAGDAWPLVVFSHCSNCTRYSSSTIAEQLASWGFAVVAPDHVDNTVFDDLDGSSVGVSPGFLATRGDDLTRVIDAIAADGEDVPAGVRGRLDATRLGVMGHSFGSVTAGWVAERDDRVRAVVSIAAPMENPLLPGVSIAGIDVPVLMLLAQEDNSILEIGNNLIRNNFDDANSPVWLVEFIDAGHWSFSDLCGLVAGFSPGCGDGVRQTVPGEPFTYVDIEATRARAADWATTFFAAYLLEDAGAQGWLVAPPVDAAITVASRP